MKPLRSNLKKLSLAVAGLMALAVVLLSAHYHSEIKTAEKNSSCSICQISQNFTKSLQHFTSTSIAPHTFIERFISFHFTIFYYEKPSVALIRGPPADRPV